MSNVSRPLLIEGRVAAILNERELAINVGGSDGVKEGMKFKVLAETPAEVRDPETNEILGVVDREKVRVEAVEVQERLSVCRTYRTYRVGGNLAAAAYDALFSAPRDVAETLRADESSFPSPLPEDESFVKKGDRVIQLLRDDK